MGTEGEDPACTFIAKFTGDLLDGKKPVFRKSSVPCGFQLIVVRCPAIFLRETVDKHYGPLFPLFQPRVVVGAQIAEVAADFRVIELMQEPDIDFRNAVLSGNNGCARCAIRVEVGVVCAAVAGCFAYFRNFSPIPSS